MDNKINTTTSYAVETYALYKNVDNSILKLNEIIKKYGYTFLAVNLPDLEKNFSSLVSLPTNFQSEKTLILDEDKSSVSGEFYDLLTNHHSFGHESAFKREVVFLKRIENFEQEVVNKTVSLGLSMNVSDELRSFSSSLIQQLRLYKNGDIVCPLEFQIAADTRKITSKSWRHSKVFGHLEFLITNEDVIALTKALSDKFTSTPLTELAINSYNLSYEIADLKTKYITLMTCLESLMNLGAHQITHTVSRHLALIISRSAEEFQTNYLRTKKLYEIRSSIVHGGKINEDLTKATNELHDKVRKAINYCLNLHLDKEGLFAKLNASGYGLT